MGPLLWFFNSSSADCIGVRRDASGTSQIQKRQKLLKVLVRNACLSVDVKGVCGYVSLGMLLTPSALAMGSSGIPGYAPESGM